VVTNDSDRCSSPMGSLARYWCVYDTLHPIEINKKRKRSNKILAYMVHALLTYGSKNCTFSQRKKVVGETATNKTIMSFYHGSDGQYFGNIFLVGYQVINNYDRNDALLPPIPQQNHQHIFKITSTMCLTSISIFWVYSFRQRQTNPHTTTRHL